MNNKPGLAFKGRYILAVLLCVITALALVGCSTASKESSYSADSDKSNLYGYTEQMIADNINPDVYMATLYRIDNTAKTPDIPRNFRTVFNTQSSYSADDGLDEAYTPSLEGLTNVKMSGSAEFDENQIDGLVSEIRQYHSGKVCIVDLRQESHFYVNGRSISWYDGLRNWGNVGKNLSEVTSDENSRMQAIKGKTIDIYNLVDKQPSKQELIVADEVETEEEVVQGHGLEYYRLACTDHVCPTDKQIDEFIDFAKNLSDDTWLHFHCEAGKGRTTFFMVVYDMMKNPAVSYKDIAYRQYGIGGNNAIKSSSDDWKSSYFAEKAKAVEQVCKYIQENHKTNYAVSFSDWKKSADSIKK